MTVQWELLIQLFVTSLTLNFIYPGQGQDESKAGGKVKDSLWISDFFPIQVFV